MAYNMRLPIYGWNLIEFSSLEYSAASLKTKCTLLLCASITFLTLWSELLFFSFSFKKSGFPHKVHVYFVKTPIVEGYVRKYAKQGDVENQGLQSCL